MPRRWWILLLSVIALPLLVWGYDRLLMTRWVGDTDLEVEFVVTDSVTGGPVPRARVEIQSEGGFYAEDFKQDFTLTGDDSGVARKECLHSMCFGTQSQLRFTDTFAVHLPFWRYRVVAGGYHSTEWIELGLPQARQVQRAGHGKAKLVVPVALRR